MVAITKVRDPGQELELSQRLCAAVSEICVCSNWFTDCKSTATIEFRGIIRCYIGEASSGSSAASYGSETVPFKCSSFGTERNKQAGASADGDLIWIKLGHGSGEF